MTGTDWRRKVQQAIERVRTRHQSIGRTSGAPFLAVVYPMDAEQAVLKEWRTQADALRPEIDVRPVDVLEVTERVMEELGSETILESFRAPMAGGNPERDLGECWIRAIIDEVISVLSRKGEGVPVVSLERLAALYPAAGPNELMNRIWNGAQSSLVGPVVILIPGTVLEQRKYSFLDRKEEFMYRGELL